MNQITSRAGILLWVTGLFTITSSTVTSAMAQPSWSPEQEQVLRAMNQLSDATALNGDGADAYGDVLDDSFSRWTVGSNVINHKEEWVNGIREWFNDGWRVADRDTEHVDIQIIGDLAFTRRIVEETYVGPGGDRTISKAAVAEVWSTSTGKWLLLIVNVHPMDNN